MPMSPRLLRPRATGFNPRSIANLAYWLDAADASTLTLVSGAVSQWRAKGSTRTFDQSTANNRPTTTTINGKTAVKFDGANDLLLSSIGEAPANRTLFIVALGETHTDSGCVFQTSNFSGQFNIFGYLSNRTPGWTLRGGPETSQFTYAGPVASASSPLFTTARFIQASLTNSSGTGNNVRINGTAAFFGGGNIQGYSPGGVTLGAADNRAGSGTFTQNYKGSTCEIIAYNAYLSDSEVLVVEKYLKNKWGVAF